jgi:hypothetical protein
MSIPFLVFNFKTVQFICTKVQETKIRQVFQETLLGPKDPGIHIIQFPLLTTQTFFVNS